MPAKRSRMMKARARRTSSDTMVWAQAATAKQDTPAHKQRIQEVLPVFHTTHTRTPHAPQKTTKTEEVTQSSPPCPRPRPRPPPPPPTRQKSNQLQKAQKRTLWAVSNYEAMMITAAPSFCVCPSAPYAQARKRCWFVGARLAWFCSLGRRFEFYHPWQGQGSPR